MTELTFGILFIAVTYIGLVMPDVIAVFKQISIEFYYRLETRRLAERARYGRKNI